MFYLQQVNTQQQSLSSFTAHNLKRKKCFIIEYFQAEDHVLTFVLINCLRLQVDFGRV